MGGWRNNSLRRAAHHVIPAGGGAYTKKQEGGTAVSSAKLKNFVILVLLLAVAFLLILVIPQQQAIHSQAETTGQLLQTLCENAGIRMDAAILPEDQTLYELELTSSSSAELAIATLLLGDGVTASEGATRFSSIYTSQNGSCSFSNGDGSFSVTLYTATEAGSRLTDFTEELLSSLGFDPTDVALIYASGQTRLVTATQQYLGVPVFSSGLTLTFTGSGLTGISGVFYISDDQPVRISDTACITCADAIVAFLSARETLGWVGEEITAVTQGYIRSGVATNLTPVWRITTDTGVIEVNGITRAVSLVE